MPADANFPLIKYEDGHLTVCLSPPAAVSGWSVRLTVSRRFGSPDPLFRKYNVPGDPSSYASGVAVTDAAVGRFRCRVASQDTSGLQPGNYAFSFERVDSGSRTLLARGYLSLGDTTGV